MADTTDVLKALLRNADKEIGGGSSATHRLLLRMIQAQEDGQEEDLALMVALRMGMFRL